MCLIASHFLKLHPSQLNVMIIYFSDHNIKFSKYVPRHDKRFLMTKHKRYRKGKQLRCKDNGVRGSK